MFSIYLKMFQLICFGYIYPFYVDSTKSLQSLLMNVFLLLLVSAYKI